MTKPLSLVTGAAGFIGSNLTDYLLAQNHQVICVDNESADMRSFIGMEQLLMCKEI